MSIGKDKIQAGIQITVGMEQNKKTLSTRAFWDYPYIPMGRRDKPNNIYGLNENLWPPIKT